MSMSVGLGKIANDPQATALTRKALGILSTPGLLVYDDALTIDDTGRIVLRVDPAGGIAVTENGLKLKIGDGSTLSVGQDGVSLTETPTIGVDSEVELNAESYDREWNARFTGSAPNFFSANIAVGEETLGGESDTADALIEKAMVNITNRETQLRLSYDARNFTSMKMLQNGPCEITVTNNSGASGVRLNAGTTIEAVSMTVANFELTGGSLTAFGYHVMRLQSFAIPARPGRDHVTICLGNGMVPTPTGNLVSYEAAITAENVVTIKVFTIGPIADAILPFFVLIHKFGTEVETATSLGSPTFWVYE